LFAAKLDLNNNILAEPGIDRINAQTRGWGNPEYNNRMVKRFYR
jgi:hypothetical protein